MDNIITLLQLTSIAKHFAFSTIVVIV